MDYLPHFRRRLTRPLVDHQNDGVGDVIDILDAYDLLREDYDNVLDISQWSHLKEPLAGVDSKVSHAFFFSFFFLFFFKFSKFYPGPSNRF